MKILALISLAALGCTAAQIAGIVYATGATVADLLGRLMQ